MMGIETIKPFPTFLGGFPQDLIDELEKAFNRTIVGKMPASGMPVLKEFGMDEINDNKLIVYTSSDSVLQICGHEKHMGLEKLYEYCDIARKICDSKPE
jgi:phosphopentomutase